MKFLPFLILFFLAPYEIFPQDSSSVVYSIKGWNYGPGGATFQRSVLILNRDSTYLEINESYLSRKFYKKNFPLSLHENHGHYNISADSLILVNKKYPNRVPDKFIIKSNRRIKLYHEDLKYEAPKSWKRILTPKYGNLKIKKKSTNNI